jgi:predicted DNA-binding ribbon-helix-helix protein
VKLRPGGLTKRSISLARHRTSVALEPEFWSALAEIAARRGLTLAALVAATDAERTPDQPLASALRVLALRAFFPGRDPPDR